MNNIEHIAFMHESKEIIAAGRTFIECCRDADKANVYDPVPGSHAPFFYASYRSKEFFGAWFPEGFWDKWKERNPEAVNAQEAA